MKRLLTAVVAAGALVALSAAPAGAQEALGFEIDIDEGSPGDVVNGQVDTDDVAQHCNTDPEELLSRFRASGEAATGDLLVGGTDPGLLHVYFPGVTDIEDLVTVDSYEQLAYLGMVAVAGNIDLELVEEAIPQTFIMTFADIATQEPVGEMGNFDPATGEGSVVVPDIDPGFWGVAAACVSPTTDLEFFQAAVSANAPLVEEIWPLFDDPGIELPIEDIPFIEIAFAGLGIALEIGEDLVPAMMEPDALGAQIFCILDADGECPEDAVPPVDPPDDGAPPAVAVAVDPAFTG